MIDFDVCIVGAGPVGLTLALDLSRRGVRSVIIEREVKPGPWPKMERCNARSMEIYRRLGVADAIRARGQAPDKSMSVAIVTNLSDPPLALLEYPTVNAMRERIAESTDGALPLEPYQMISQYTLEPILREAVAGCSNVVGLFGSSFLHFEERDDSVALHLAGPDGERILTARYLVGCDGGSSLVRKQLGIPLEGRGGISKMHQVFFRSDDLLDRIPIARARHYWFADEWRSAIIVQDDGRHFSLHSTLPADSDFPDVIRKLAGYDCKVDILNVCDWTLHLLVAESYGARRVYLAGDAAHLVIPTGGLGMNTGVGDASDLAWKLAAMIQGWGGAALLNSYDWERRAVGRRNRDASGFAAAGLAAWRNAWRPNIREASVQGQATRREVARVANYMQRRSHEMEGTELGYTYAGSPIVCSEAAPYQESEFLRYLPSASPGSRFPHVWLKDRRPIQDVVGLNYTLLDFSDATPTQPLEEAMQRLGAPLTVVRFEDPAAHAIGGRNLVLLRPDLHVAWRGDEAPENSDAVAARVTGHGDAE
jgi:2-polyprenyl-6-methoxyphenol hydroxylase-like FAD-dependent oxidoreductase